MIRNLLALGIATAGALAACGTNNADLIGRPDGGGAASGVRAISGATSGAGGGGAASGGGSTSGTAGSSGGASSGSTSTSGGGAPTGVGPLGGTGGCPMYEAPCGGQCTLIAGDPKNCGACGATCGAGQVCSGGVCGGGCPTGSGETACNGTCVDTSTDNNNCGACGHACGANMGCLGGTCGAAKTFPTPMVCAGGGPQIIVNPTGSAPMCLGNIAQTTFTWSLCSCKNVDFEDNALIDGWNSTVGPYKPGQLGGGVGADGAITAMSTADIWGQAWAAGTGTAFNGGQFNVHVDLQSGGNTVGSATVSHDAYVAGNIDTMTVGGTLYQTPGKSHPGNLKPVAQNVTVTPPCDCTNPIPVAATVAWAKTNNDNMAIGLDPGIMTQAGHPSRIDLPCGKYYMTGFSSGGLIVAHGHVALFIDGNAASSGGDLTMTVADPTSTFDIYVSGTIMTASNFHLGSPSYPALTRLYLGGTQTLDIQAELIIGAEVWAGNAPVLWESTSDLFGSIFAGNFSVLSSYRQHQDEGILYAGAGCPPPGGGNPGGTSGNGGSSGNGAPSGNGGSSGVASSGGASSGATGPAPTCGTCKDCGNQACIKGTCGSCVTNSDCCSPLVCNAGTCAPFIVR